MDKNKLIISDSFSIREAIKRMDKAGRGFVFLVNDAGDLTSLITDGDFRRAVLNGTNLDEKVTSIANSNFVRVKSSDSEKLIINNFLKYRINFLPIVDNGELIDIVYRTEYNLDNRIILPEKEMEMPVVIMAGGKGSRLAPFTNILPKPLIPIGNRSMLELIMDEYSKFGLSNFYLTINYKGNLIKAYFADLNHNYNLTYIEEEKYLGTAGSLKLLNLKSNAPVFVSNCDILIRDNYLNILNFHKEGNHDLTLVAAMTHYQVPYGVCKIKNGGELDSLAEKPEYDYLVNSGMYIVNSDSFELIPENEFFHITDLIHDIRKNGGKVGVYPVSEKSWIDVGQWNEFTKALKLIQD